MARTDLGRMAATTPGVNPTNHGWQMHDDEGRQSDGEGTFAETLGNDKVAPIALVRRRRRDRQAMPISPCPDLALPVQQEALSITAAFEKLIRPSGSFPSWSNHWFGKTRHACPRRCSISQWYDRLSGASRRPVVKAPDRYHGPRIRVQ